MRLAEHPRESAGALHLALQTPLFIAVSNDRATEAGFAAVVGVIDLYFVAYPV
jgi:hypothetical protein